MWYRLIFLLLCSVYAGKLFSAAKQPDLFAGADSLCTAGKYNEAALACEKILFLNADPAVRGEALLHKGRCLKAAGNYTEAVRNLKRADTLPLPDSLQYFLRYESALCAYLSSNAAEAAFQLTQIRLMNDSSWRDSCLLLQALVDLEQENWAAAKQHVIRYAQFNHLVIDTTQLIGDEKELKLKSKTKARRLSIIVPGLGQVYAGKPIRGLTSFILVTGSLAYGAWTVLDGYYISGTATGLGLAARFYSGGVRYAGKLADEYNARKIEAYQEKIRARILKKQP
ncbi:MAG: hypothetical protein FD123_2117 [Bacteroidetes bacterium]|nr:MAG: hypothetical protein FD123_2117 [Bacteroidota bacterium]